MQECGFFIRSTFFKGLNRMNEITEKWDDILKYMEEEIGIGSVAINTWIRPLKPYNIEGNCISFVLLDNLKAMKEFLNRKYLEPLRAAIIEITMKNYTVEFLLEDEIEDFVSEKKENGSVQTDINKEKAKNAGLNPKYTFDSFVVGESNRLSYSACLAAAEAPGMLYNPLFLYGGVGLGKTHLMHSIARYIMDNMPEKKTLYVTSEDFTNEVVNAIRTNTQTQLKDKYRKVDVLLIDDIQFLENKEGTQEEFFHTFNALFNERKQIVISSDKPPQELRNMEQRLVSRFSSGLSTDIISPDYETRMAILQKKENLENYNFDNSILDYIATNITSNIRELEGALNKLIAFHNLEKKPVTLEIAQHELRDLISPNAPGEVTMDTIISIVTAHFNVSEEDVLSKKRAANIVLPRHIIMYFCRALTDNTLDVIGRRLGNRDYTTVMHGVNNITEKYTHDTNLKNTIDMLRKKINPM